MASGPNSSYPVKTWDELAIVFGEQCVSDFQKTINEKSPKPSRTNSFRIGIRHFMHWLCVDGSAAARRTVNLFSEGQGDLDDAQSVGLLVSAFNRWQETYGKAAGLTPLSVRNYAIRAAEVLDWMGSESEGRYPPFRRNFVSISHVTGNVQTLGGLGWPEMDGLKGVAAERKALSMVKEAAMAEFVALEKLFQFGQNVLASHRPETDVDPEAWQMVKTIIETERNSWLKGGQSQFNLEWQISDEVVPLLSTLKRRETWIAAGLPQDVADILMPADRPGGRSLGAISVFLLGCLGPTRWTTSLALAILTCEIGWNRQPILDLPRDPFLYRSRSECGLVSSAFLQSFKARAKHDVLAYVESGKVLSGLAHEAVKAEWLASSNAFDATGNNDGYSVLQHGRSDGIVDFIERFQVLVDAIRPFDIRHEHETRFFVYLTPTHGLFLKPYLSPSECSLGVLSREGVGVQSIRKTFLALKVREVGSIDAVRPIAGHAGTSVLMAHYLNTDDIKAELDESIRFFQNACQVLLLTERPHAVVELGIPQADFEWFQKLAAQAGISVAVGFREGNDMLGGSPSPVFDPTDANLRDLFLTHWALRSAQREMPILRWKVQGLPLLGMIKGIGRTLCAKGLRQHYRAAARKAHRELVTGDIVLPPVLEG